METPIIKDMKTAEEIAKHHCPYWFKDGLVPEWLLEAMQAYASECCKEQREKCAENAKIYRNAPRDSSIDFKFYGGNDEDYTIHDASILETPLVV